MNQQILSEIEAERDRQDARWGVQDHHLLEWNAILGEEVGEVAQAIVDYHFQQKPVARVREECIQAAAVLAAMVEYIDERLISYVEAAIPNAVHGSELPTVAVIQETSPESM